ncbi:adenine deaminase C-terminal domain-containing protein [Microvirga sp. W0021]|uniref:Adenine deaminase n=1 Tax=Hohaiivirga grylli TaxID=3133970 RepID=A0ABV0BI71_9HYPH
MTEITAQSRARAVKAAQGLEPFDLLLTNATLVDVATAELRAADVGIIDNMIASVHPQGTRQDAKEVVDLTGRFLAPGLIDMHVHFESSHMTPANYASVIVPQGTTTIMCDPHELANVFGMDGVRYGIEASKGLPLRILFTAPSSIPSTEGLETSGAYFSGKEMEEMLSWPEVVGVAEVMDMKGVLAGSKRMTEIVAAGIKANKLVEGHARGLKGPELQAYLAAGVTSDHELTSAEDFLEKLRSGLSIEIRGSHDYLLPDIVKALNELPFASSQISICTDDVFPDDLVSKGGICDVLRRLIQYGLDPVTAIRFATLNASYRLRRTDIGLISAGRIADIVVLSDLQTMKINTVYASGKIVPKGVKIASPPVSNMEAISHSMKVRPLTLEDFEVRVPNVADGIHRLRAIHGARFTEWHEADLEVKNGFAVLPDAYNRLFIMNRHGKPDAQPQCALLGDWGTMTGALATSYSHDSHNLVVLGKDPKEMLLAANSLIEMGGGVCVVKNGRVIASIALPIAGMISEEDPEIIRQNYNTVKAATDTIMEWKPPYRVFKAIEGISLACNAGPHLTDLGLTDGGTKEILPILASQPAIPV